MASGIMKELKERSIDGHLFKHMHQLMEHGYGADIWRHGGVIAQLVMVHFIRLEDPDKWVQSDEAGGYRTYVDAMNMLRDTLSMNPQVCQLLESLWSARTDIATFIDSTSIQLLTTHMVNVHTKFVMGCAKYLACTLKPGWNDTLDSDSQFSAVQGAVSTYLMVVQNLPLDAGHWHELWAAGDEIALCLMEHFFLHEDQRDERWSAEHVRSPAKYLNRNLQNLRDVVAANPEVCQVLNALKTSRPDLWAVVDGRALQRMANCLRSVDLLLGCVTFLETSLVGNWQEGLSNPRAELQRYIDMYVSNVYQMMGQPPPFCPSLSPRQTRSSMNGSPFFSPKALSHSPTPSPTYQSGFSHPLSHIYTPPASPSALSPVMTPTAQLSPYSTPPASPSHLNHNQIHDNALQALFNLSLNAPPPAYHSPFPSPPATPSPHHHNLPNITPFISTSPAPSPEPHSPFDLPASPPPNSAARQLKQHPSFSFHPGLSPFAAPPTTTPPTTCAPTSEFCPSTTPMSPTLDPIISLNQILNHLPAHPTITSPAISPATTPRKLSPSPPLDMWETQGSQHSAHSSQGSQAATEQEASPLQMPASPSATSSPTNKIEALPRLPTLTPQPSY